MTPLDVFLDEILTKVASETRRAGFSSNPLPVFTDALDEAKAALKQRIEAENKKAYRRGHNTGWVSANRNNDGKRFAAAATELHIMADRFDGFAAQLTHKKEVI